MNIKELLLGAITEGLVEGIEGIRNGVKKRTRLGKVSKYIVDLHDKKANMQESLEHDMDLRIRQLALESKRKMQEEFDGRIAEVEEFTKKVWEETYLDMKVDPNGDYTFSRLEGVLYENTLEDNIKPFKR